MRVRVCCIPEKHFISWDATFSELSAPLDCDIHISLYLNFLMLIYSYKIIATYFKRRFLILIFQIDWILGRIGQSKGHGIGFGQIMCFTFENNFRGMHSSRLRTKNILLFFIMTIVPILVFLLRMKLCCCRHQCCRLEFIYLGPQLGLLWIILGSDWNEVQYLHWKC